MSKRLLLAGIIPALLSIGPAADAHCAGIIVTAYYEAHVQVDGFTVSATEDVPYALCAEDDPGARPIVGRLVITDTNGNVVRCNRSDVDPAYDPFFFGAGINTSEDDACGAQITWVSLENPPLPDPTQFTALPPQAGLRKETPASGEFWYTVGGERVTVTVLEDDPAWQVRGVRVTPDF